MPSITSVRGRIVFNSRGSKTIEIDVVSDGKFMGRACAPSGASVDRLGAELPGEQGRKSPCSF